jgi:hypothetical protein
MQSCIVCEARRIAATVNCSAKMRCEGNRWLILDNLTLTLLADSEAKYSPLFVLDDAGVRFYAPRLAMIAAAPCG